MGTYKTARANRELIAYCGLYCGGCPSYLGKIADMARDLRKELRQAKFARQAEGMPKISFFSTFKNYPTCYEVLGTMVRLRCGKGCLEGGDNPYCKTRSCYRRKGIEDCWECSKFEVCNKLDFLCDVHDDAHIKNLKKLKKVGVDAFLTVKKFW
jgi:hypothetical protein